MADKKITQLPSLSFISGSTTGYYAGEVVLPIVHNSTTVKMEAQKFALYATQWSATTASNTFIGNQTINGNVTTTGDVIVQGKLTAQEVHTEITSASIIFESGSTIFGNSGDDTHQFTGTLSINGEPVGTGQLNAQTSSQEVINAVMSYVTGAMNSQSSSQDAVNFRNSTITSSLNSTTASLNQATSSLNFASGALNVATGSYNRFYQTTASLQATTASLNQATSSLNFASGALNLATGSYNRFYDMTSSVHFTTQSLNVQTGSQESINTKISIVTGSIDAHILGISIYTASVISQTNTIATFTSSVNFATQSLNTQTGSQNSLNTSLGLITSSIYGEVTSFNNLFGGISSVTGAFATELGSIEKHILAQAKQTASQDLVNNQNSIVTSSFRAEIGGIEAYTSSLKNAIIVNGTNVQIVGELDVARLNVQYVSSSVAYSSGSNIFGDASNDKHEFTGSVTIADTLFIKGQAIGLGELNAQTASQQNVNGQIGIATGSLNAFTGSQINKDFTLSKVTASIDAHILGVSIVTSSINTHILGVATQTGSQDIVNFNISKVTASIDAHILKQSTQTGSQDLVNLGISTFTGSIRSELNLIEALTASMKASTILSSSTQIQNYDVFALNSNLYNSTGSLQAQVNGIMAVTASMKAASIVSSSQQIRNYSLFAVTSSANTFYGTQTLSGSVLVQNDLTIGNNKQSTNLLAVGAGATTTIVTLPNMYSSAGLVYVVGDNGSWGFADLVAGGFTTAAVMVSTTIYGSPPSRTYSRSTNDLQINCASAANIRVAVLAGLMA